METQAVVQPVRDAGEVRLDVPANSSEFDGAKGRQLARLRERIRRIEGTDDHRFAEDGQAGAPTRLPLGVPAADRALGGGLPLAGMTELRITETRDSASGAGFALALAVLLKAVPHRPVLWIGEASAFGEGGDFSRAGLSGLGLDPAAILFVRARRLIEAVWAGEEAARSGALSLVVLETRGNPRPLGLPGTRRLHLRAAGSGLPFILLRQASDAEPTAAPFRLGLSSAPSGRTPGTRLIGRPAFSIALEKSPDGRPTRFILEWNSDEHRFEPRSLALSGAFPAPAFDRPDPAREAGGLVALSRAS